MVTVLEINNQEFIFKQENLSQIFRAMNKEQIDIFFKRFKDEQTSMYNLVIGTETYIGSIMHTFEKMSHEGLISYKKMHECNKCKKVFAADTRNEVYTRRGKIVLCEDCLRQDTERCPHCNKTRLKTEVLQMVEDNKTIISCCYAGLRHREHLTSCVHCHRLYENSSWSFRSSHTLCPICRDHFDVCDDCGRPVEKGKLTKGICDRCIKARKVRDAIKSYSYKPDPSFLNVKGEATPIEYMGLEWEMELIADSTFKKRKHKMIENEEWLEDRRHTFFAYELGELGKDWAYCKSDGSLNYGVEFVTHPISLKAWEQIYYPKLCAIKECMKAWGCRTKAATAGIHIHYSRARLDSATIKRICWLLSKEENFEYMRKFCHRNADNMNHWARKHSNWRQDIEDFYPDTSNRYRIVNLCNSNTIEFRCFGYTIDPDEIMIYLYAVDSIVNYCRDHKNQDVMKANMVEVLTYRNTEKMVEYLEKRSDLDKCV